MLLSGSPTSMMPSEVMPTLPIGSIDSVSLVRQAWMPPFTSAPSRLMWWVLGSLSPRRTTVSVSASGLMAASDCPFRLSTMW